MFAPTSIRKVTPCPCGTIDEFVAHIESKGVPDITCTTTVDVSGNTFLSIDTAGFEDGLVFTFLPPFDTFGRKRTCGLDGTSLETVEELEALSCAHNIRATAAQFDRICSGP